MEKKKETPNLNEKERAVIEIGLGQREPKNENEKELKKDIEAIKKQGLIVDMPGEIPWPE